MSDGVSGKRTHIGRVPTDTGDPALPVAGQGILSGVRRSPRARIRAAVLIGVHLVIAAHIAHFVAAGRTLSPVEPSEAMYTLELGQLNAGFIFLIVALLSTLIFGRFFCGWGCHIVALQDFCAFLMKKLGVRPRPFRSRALLWMPALLAFYMFLWPTIDRLWISRGSPFPGVTNHLLTDGFWETFPGPLFAVLTFAVCGFAAVYFLGAKGFCSYGCPYGALFGWADALSPGRIVVSDACEGCGHCTVTCTSNVAVHDEVRRFGQVVDPGCMKCMDCVSVCPKGALSYGFRMPAILARPKKPAMPGRTRLGWRTECCLFAVGIASALAFRGLYDGPPLLMSIGLGAITAFVAFKIWRMFRGESVRLQQLELRGSRGRSTTGSIFLVAGLLWLAFTLHSGIVQWERYRGRSLLQRAEIGSGRSVEGPHERAVERAAIHFERADRWGLVDVVEVKLGLAWTRLLGGDDSGAVQAMERARSLAADGALDDSLLKFHTLRGDEAAVRNLLDRKFREGLTSSLEEFQLADLLVRAGESERAIEVYAHFVELEPLAFEGHFNLGGLLRRVGRQREAIASLRTAVALVPTDPDVHVELGLALAAVGENLPAVAALQEAIRLAPHRPESQVYLPQLIDELGRTP